MRQGDAYGSGVSAAALAQYEAADQVAFLAAVAACPAVALLWSPHPYAQHSAARLLSHLVRASSAMPALLVEAGAVRGLLPQLDLQRPFAYNRCSAAATLAGLCRCAVGREEVRGGGGVALLKALVARGEGLPPDKRFEQRDAAGALLVLRLSPEEAAAAPATPPALLRRLAFCSHSWLLGRAAAPTEGYSPEEAAARCGRGRGQGEGLVQGLCRLAACASLVGACVRLPAPLALRDTARAPPASNRACRRVPQLASGEEEDDDDGEPEWEAAPGEAGEPPGGGGGDGDRAARAGGADAAGDGAA